MADMANQIQYVKKPGTGSEPGASSLAPKPPTPRAKAPPSPAQVAQPRKSSGNKRPDPMALARMIKMFAGARK